MRVPTLALISEQLNGDGHEDLAAYLDARAKALSPLACWWAMVEAHAELSEHGPIPPDAVVLHFMGSGASTQLTAQQMRAALLPDNAGDKAPQVGLD